MDIKVKRSYLITISSAIALILFSVIYAFITMFVFRHVNNYKKPYLDFLQKVYVKMDENYYEPVSKKTYEEFREKYIKKILPQIKDKSKIDTKILHLGAGLLVNKLKRADDTFTNFIPPKEAKEYSKKIYGYENGIGIEGALVKDFFVIEHVEIRSEAFLKGIRTGDILATINGKNVGQMTKEEIHNLLYPPLGTKVDLEIFIPKEKKVEKYTVTCREYFLETLVDIPTPVEGVYYFKMATFNKETANDLKNLIKKYGPDNIKYLILDLRGNPGGPPLAVREICGMMLPPGQKLFYYEKRNAQPFGLSTLISDVYYKGRLVIVIDKQSGSSSELLAGTLKAYKRAIVVGKESTAGFAFLKGKFDFEDGSMLALITGKTFLFDGTCVDTAGISPNFKIPGNTKNVEAFIIKQVVNT